jgi:pimeloyl-ACP methyl ester carboxylesterase
MLLLGAFVLRAQRLESFVTPRPVQPGSAIVIGFLGGFERWNDPHRGVRRVALDIRGRQIPGVYAETVENHRRDVAVKLIKKAAMVKGTLVPNVRVILYGQSWGGAAVFYAARKLKKLGMDVDLTIQLDSVGVGDTIVPSNVHAAANLYQRDPLTVRGNQDIRPEDPSKTRILENTRLSYFFRPFETLDRQDASWARRWKPTTRCGVMWKI